MRRRVAVPHILPLPAGHFRGVVIDDAIAHGLFQDADEYRQAVLNRRSAASVSYPVTRLGMSTGAMYAHFRSKEEMLFEVCLTGHRRVTAALAEAAETAAGPADQLAGMVRVFTVCHARFHVIAKIVQYELYAMSEEHLAQVLDVRRRTSALMEDVLWRGVAAGEFTVPDVAGVGRALLSLCIDVARWYQPGHSSTPEELGELYAELAVRMVGTQPV